MGSDGQQSCGRPKDQCARFMKDKPDEVVSYTYAWIVGGDKEPPLVPHVNLRTALFLEKTMTAVYLLSNINDDNLRGALPPRHKQPCFKLDDPFDNENLDRIERAIEWLREATNKY